MKFLLFFLITLSASAQSWPSPEFIVRNNYQEVLGDTTGLKQQLVKPRFAMYPNGKEGINNHIMSHLKVPNAAVKPLNEGRVLLQYVIDKEGYVSDIRVLQSAGQPYDDEAKRVLLRMERWIPGENDGQVVKVSYRQGFRFL